MLNIDYACGGAILPYAYQQRQLLYYFDLL